MSGLRPETIAAALALARKFETAAASLHVLAAHPSLISLQAASAPMGAVFDVAPVYLEAANEEFQRAVLAGSTPGGSA